jgi:hypothetical protein
VWMSLVLAGLSIRADLAGVSSFVRALGLVLQCYKNGASGFAGKR